jgi:diguanylate cyclase (GGDEF)-like protein
VDCIVRNLSDQEASLAVQSTIGLPRTFDLLINGETASRPCCVKWQTDNRVTVEFWSPQPAQHKDLHRVAPPRGSIGESKSQTRISHATLVRSSLVTLRASLDEVDFGVVLLDAELHATFVNRAFRKLWHLSDADCSSRPAFLELIRYGQTALGHSVSSKAFEEHTLATVARVEAGDSTPVDLRLPDGEVLRFQCVALPCGGRMLSYTRVTDIVRHADELEVLRNAIDNVEQGIVLINESLFVQFVNKKAKSYWGLSPEQCNNKLTIAEYIAHVRKAGLYGVPDNALDDYVVKRVTMIKTGDQTPIDIPVQDGRTIRAQCTPLIGGGRMLTYTDVTDLVERAEQQELLATTDVLTGLHNRRHFLRLADVESDRFRRYKHEFSILFFDIDNLKAINDRLGHEAGDRAIMRVAEVCDRERRTSDIVARMGGDEFVVLLPETDQEATVAFAERLHKAIGCQSLDVDGVCINLTISIGIARMESGVPDINQLLKIADARLYRAKKAGRNCIIWHDEVEGEESLQTLV